MGDLAKIVGDRLKHEIGRRGSNAVDISRLTGLDHAEVDRIVKGAVMADLKSLHRICNSLSLNIFRILSESYKPCQIHFRGLSTQARNFVSDIEDAFLLIADFLPKMRIPPAPRPDSTDRDYQYLIATIQQSIQWVKTRVGSDPLSMSLDTRLSTLHRSRRATVRFTILRGAALSTIHMQGSIERRVDYRCEKLTHLDDRIIPHPREWTSGNLDYISVTAALRRPSDAPLTRPEPPAPYSEPCR
jgi:hypothetical protein